MNYVEFQVENKTYKLRLSTRNTISLEKTLGCNPVAIFGSGDTIPTITTMVRILHASLQAYEHGITLDDAYDIFDRWIDEGHLMTDFILIIIDIYKASGLIKKDNAGKN
jgi:hypothetical protein